MSCECVGITIKVVDTLSNFELKNLSGFSTQTVIHPSQGIIQIVFRSTDYSCVLD